MGKLSLSSKIIGGLVIVLLLLGYLWISSCQANRTAGVQKKVDQGQMGAFTNSATDAINTQAAANQRENEARELSRQNERDIRNAQGANAPVDPALRDASLRAWCRHAAYRDSERCRVFQPRPR